MMDRTFGAMIAVPMPWASLAATRKPASGAAAHSAEVTVNVAIPTQNNRLRP
jgi:hypothetical protein